MKYDIQFTNQFKKDLKLAKKQNKKSSKRQIMRLVELTFLCQTLKNTKKLIVF